MTQRPPMYDQSYQPGYAQTWPPPEPRKSIIEQIDRPVTLLIIVLSFAGGVVLKGINIAGSVVTQDQYTRGLTEIKTSIDAMRAYVDAKSAEGLDKAEKYSDSNRLQTLNDMKTNQAQIQDAES